VVITPLNGNALKKTLMVLLDKHYTKGFGWLQSSDDAPVTPLKKFDGYGSSLHNCDRAMCTRERPIFGSSN
jgi:hypothetical protein